MAKEGLSKGAVPEGSREQVSCRPQKKSIAGRGMHENKSPERDKGMLGTLEHLGGQSDEWSSVQAEEAMSIQRQWRTRSCRTLQAIASDLVFTLSWATIEGHGREELKRSDLHYLKRLIVALEFNMICRVGRAESVTRLLL